MGGSSRGGRFHPRWLLAAGAGVAVAGQTRAYPHADALASIRDTELSASGPEAVARAVLVAVGASLVALAAGSATDLAGRVMQASSRAVRAYVAGLCVAAGLLLGYHGWTELRGGGATLRAVLERVWPVGLVLVTAIMLAGLTGQVAGRARRGGRRSRGRPVRPRGGRA